MSLTLEFEPHSWYKHFAIKDNGTDGFRYYANARGFRWEAYTDDGNTYQIIMLEADTLKDLKEKITLYWEKRG